MRIFYQSPVSYSLDEENEWSREFTYQMMEQFSNYPVVVKFIEEPELANAYDNLFLALTRMFKKNRLGDTRGQYVSIKDIPQITPRKMFYNISNFDRAQEQLIRIRREMVLEEFKAKTQKKD
jgi:hypothetical protein